MNIILLYYTVITLLMVTSSISAAQAPYNNWLNYTNNDLVTCIGDDGEIHDWYFQRLGKTK